jgi:hypothetical protein
MGIGRSLCLAARRGIDKLRTMCGRSSGGALRALTALCALIGALMIFPSAAVAASGTINSVSVVDAPWGGMEVARIVVEVR